MGKRGSWKPDRGAIGIAFGGERLIELRKAGKVPEGPIVVSYIGFVHVPNFLLIANAGRQYDWRLVHGLNVVCFTDDINLSDLHPIAKEASECSVWCPSRQRGAWLYRYAPRAGDTYLFGSPALDALDWTDWQNKEFSEQVKEHDGFASSTGQF